MASHVLWLVETTRVIRQGLSGARHEVKVLQKNLLVFAEDFGHLAGRLSKMQERLQNLEHELS